MTKFWKMLVALFAMSAMVILPSCKDDEDDDDNNSGNLLAGKIFNEEGDNDYFRFNADGTYDYYGWEAEENYPYAYEEHGTYKMVENSTTNFVLTYTDSDGDVENEVYQIIKVDDKYYIGEVGDDLDYVQVNTSFETVISEYNVWKKKADAYNEAQKNPQSQGKTSISVEAGKTYAAVNSMIAFKFNVVRVSGHYFNKDQEVVISIDGYNGEYTLSDAGHSYLMWDGSQFMTVNKATADINANNIVMILACATSTADYTITSATANRTLASYGAIETLFALNSK